MPSKRSGIPDKRSSNLSNRSAVFLALPRFSLGCDSHCNGVGFIAGMLIIFGIEEYSRNDSSIRTLEQILQRSVHRRQPVVECIRKSRANIAFRDRAAQEPFISGLSANGFVNGQIYQPFLVDSETIVNGDFEPLCRRM